MAELKSKKSFGLAFSEAEKLGLKKFQWNGGWYTTEKSDKKSAPTKGGVDKANYKQKMANKNGTVSNRFVVKHDKNVGYYVWDNDLLRPIGKTYKTKEEAAKYITSLDVDDKYEKGFMVDAGDAVATAAWKKINRKTPGFLPVDENKNFQGKDGNTRLYQERGTGRYLVTDNYGNIVGYSFDPAAATADLNWGGWIAYTGSKNDLKAAEAGKQRDLSNRNEDAQKTKLAKDRVTDEWERQMGGIRRLQGGFNTVQGMLNMPNNIITGAIRAGVSDQYSWDDYVNSFTIDGLWRGNQSIGAGDIFEFNNPYARFAANFINPMALLTLRGGLGKKTTKGADYNSHAATHNADAHVVQTKATGSARPVNAERMNIHERISPEGPSRITDNIWNNNRSEVGVRLLELGEKPVWKPILTGARSLKGDFSLINPKNGQVTTTGPAARTQSTDMIKATYERAPMTETSIRTTPRTGTMKITTKGFENTTYDPWMSMKPFNAAFRYDPNVSYNWEEAVPVANFWYSGEGNPNAYAHGRIATGEVVPGTSGENWSGGQSGGAVVVDNTNGHVSPAFGGVTVGGGKDNQSSWYLPFAYKKGGKAKLISRKSCRK